MSPTISNARAQVVDSFGAPDVLRAGERALPAPGPGQLQIRVVAAAVNPVDVQTRAGKVIGTRDAGFPMVLGWDVAGTIEQLADDVAAWPIGGRVAAMIFQPQDLNGTYTELMNVAADLVAPVPADLSLEQAATVPLAGLTASQMLGWLDLPSGATLLVNGPTGAVGGFVVQLARRAGLRVIAVATPEDRDHVLGLGANQIVDRGVFAPAVRELHPDGVDAAVDVVGRAASSDALASVRDGGACVTSFTDYDDPTNTLRPERDIRTENFVVHPDTAQLTDLLDAAARGELTTAIAESYPLADAAEAHRRLEQGGLRGKLVLLP